MSKKKQYLALDFGIARGEAMAGSFDGKRVELELMHRFPVQSTTMLGIHYWDFPGMIINAKQGMRLYSDKYGKDLSGVGCSSWAPDFGLLDKTGHLLANPVHYTDARTTRVMERLHSIIPERSLYQKTGAKSRRQGTLYQLFTMALSNSPLLDKAVTMLMMADLISYFLTGIPVQEYTLATTSGMYDAESSDWSRDVIVSAKIPPVMVPEIIAPGTMIGPMVDSVAAECGLGMVPVIAPASHGMADAVAAVPATGDDWLFIVSGHWNQVGVEVAEPIINDDGFSAGFTNEGGVDGSFRLVKGISGMALLKGCAAVWNREDDKQYRMDELVKLAEPVQGLQRLFNPNDPSVYEASDVPAAIRAVLKQSGQPAAESRAELVRACLDSTAMAERQAIAQLMQLTGKKYSRIHMVGYGAGLPLICQLTADATGIPVKAGPIEAKSLGNVLMQAIALGDIGSLAEAREIVAASFPVVDYAPNTTQAWDDAYGRFLKLL